MVFAIGIFNIPVFDIGEAREDPVAGFAGQVDDEVGVFQGFEAERFGGESFYGIAVGEKRFFREGRKAAKRVEARAGRFHEIRGVVTSDRLRHGATTGIADADEEDAEFIGWGHREIVAL